ncbi:MAG: hypothetical protein KDA96_27195, partial [Planctomycetaceae bacterium]|nr:hypothetical protein [Planctomycetaceae bacterium]
VWWICRRIRAEREAACDAAAVRVTQQPLVVATALLDSAELAAGKTPLTALAANGGSLEDRVGRLVNPGRRSAMQLPWCSLFVAAICSCLAFVSLSVGTTAVAVQVQRDLTPAEQVEAVVDAVKSVTPDIEPHPTDLVIQLRGRFVNEDGQPLLLPKDQRFRCSSQSYVRDRQHSRSSSGTVQIKEDGTFAARSYGWSQNEISVWMDGYATCRFGPFPTQGSDVDLGDLVVSRGFAATIQFQDEDGSPVSGVTMESVFLQSPESGTGIGISRYGDLVSNDDGKLTLHDLGNSPLQITVVRAGYEWNRREIRFEPGKEIAWTLHPSLPVVGTVLIPDSSEPLEGAEVWLVHRGSAEGYRRDPRKQFLRRQHGESESSKPDAVTDSQGRFELNTLQADSEYTFMILHPNWRPEVLYSVRAGMKIDVTMKPPIVVSGQLTGDLSKLGTLYRSKQRMFQFRNPLQVTRKDGTFFELFDCEVADDGSFLISTILPGPTTLELAGRSVKIDAMESVRDLEFDLDAPKSPPSPSRRI